MLSGTGCGYCPEVLGSGLSQLIFQKQFLLGIGIIVTSGPGVPLRVTI